MPCQRGPTRCAEPAFISGYSSKIIPGVPTARYPIDISVTSVGKRLTPFSFTFSSFPSRENIELNRRTFNEGYISFFQLAQSIADLMTELDDLESWLLQGTISRSPSWTHLPPLTPQHPFSINNRAQSFSGSGAAPVLLRSCDSALGPTAAKLPDIFYPHQCPP